MKRWHNQCTYATYFQRGKSTNRKGGTINVHVQRIFREANKLTHFVANTTINKEGKQVFLSINQLPSLGRKILNMDKH